MPNASDPHQAKLIDRLASTTLRLRNLFYVNLLLAGAVIFLVFQDPSFVSERIGPAIDTLQPILKVDAHLKANRARFTPYHRELLQTFAEVQAISQVVADTSEDLQRLSGEEREALEKAFEEGFNETERDFLGSLSEFQGESEGARRLLESYFDLDLRRTDYYHLAGFGGFLLFADSWTQALERGRDIVIKADKIIAEFLGHQSPLLTPEQTAHNLRRLDLEWQNDWVIQDSVLKNLLYDLPSVGEYFHAVMIIEAFCQANRLGSCSLDDIEKWQRVKDATSSSKLSAPGIEVQIAREYVLPAAPLVLLVAFHLYVIQFRRRQVLRGALAPRLSAEQLNLLDETWVLNGLVLNLLATKGRWRRLQSMVMAVFGFVVEVAPLAAILVAGFYIFEQLRLAIFIARELILFIADLREMAATIGVDALPTPPEGASLLVDYLWITVAGISAVIVAGSLGQLLRDQVREIKEAWQARSTA